MNLANASIRFRAEHYSPQEGWHAHAWKITAHWPWRPWKDGNHVKGKLLTEIDRLTEVVDGRRRLPLPLWSNESLAEALELQKYVVRVDIDRPGHGLIVWLVEGRV